MRKGDDLSVWRLLFRVIELGSLSRAAEECGLDVSSVSRRLTQLEDSLGTQLISRSSRVIKLTSEGERAYGEMRRLIDQVDLLTGSLGEQPRELTGKIRISAPLPVGETLIAGWLLEFQRLHPGVVIDLFLAQRYVDLLVEQFDLTVRVGPVRDERVVARKLGVMPLVMSATPEYLAQHGTPRHPDELVEHNVLPYIGPKGLQPQYMWRGEEKAQLFFKSSMQSNNINAIYHAALASVGIQIRAPLWMAKPDLDSGRLVHVLPEWRTESPTAYALRLPSPHPRPCVLALIDWLAQCWENTATLQEQALDRAISPGDKTPIT